MTNIDPSTPQLKAIKKWIDTLCSLDMSKLPPLIARNFAYKSIPNDADMPEIREQGQETHMQWLQGVRASVSKFEVRIPNCFQPRRLIPTPRSIFTR